MQTYDFHGLLSSYRYQLAVAHIPWAQSGGCYIFSRYMDGHPVVLRVGICDNFQTRPMPPAHECWAEAVRDYGATHLWVRSVLDAKAREAEEQDLIAAHNPPMNVHFRTGPTGTPSSGLGGLFAPGLINRGGKR